MGLWRVNKTIHIFCAILPLGDLEKTQRAIQLAQKYKDFGTLVRLSADNEDVITGYIAKYQQEFANALFQWYLDTGTQLYSFFSDCSSLSAWKPWTSS